MPTAIATIFLGIALLGVAITLASALLARRGAPLPILATWPSVTILKPLHGADPALADNLESVFAQAYAGPVQIVFGAREATDSGMAIARQLAGAHPGADVACIVDASRWGANNKLSNLINMMPAAHGEVIIVADSDTRWAPDTVGQLVAALAVPGTGLASCLIAGQAGAGFWSRLAAMDLSYRYMPAVLLGIALGLARPVLGPTVALRHDTLAAIGGFGAFVDMLADDYEIGRAVRRTGLRTIVAPLFVTHICDDRSFAALWGHELRWSITVFRIDPLGYVGSLLLHGLSLSLIGALIAGFTPPAIGIVVAAIGARALVKARMDRMAGNRAGSLALLPLRDLLSFALFCATFFVDNVNWRGTKFRVTRDGKLHSQ